MAEAFSATGFAYSAVGAIGLWRVKLQIKLTEAGDEMWQQSIRRWMNRIFRWLPRDERHSEAEPEKAGAKWSGTAGEPQQRSAEFSRESIADTTEPRQEPVSPESKPEAKAPSAPSKTGSAPTREAKPAGKARASGSDAAAREVTAIKGIGPAMQAKLASLNIRTVGDLAEADATSLLEDLKPTQRNLTRERVEDWIQAARKSS